MNFHPENELIKSFARGSLVSPLGIMVSAHVNTCSECSRQYQNYIQEFAEELESETFILDGQELEDNFLSVMNKINNDQTIASNKINKFKLDVSGQVIELPAAMNFLADQKISWKEFGKKNAIAPVSVSKEGNLYLIYIGPGESVPHHDHSGIEYTFVAAGSFDDGIASFTTGDFSVSKSGYSHTPKATSSDGCLVISWVEGRLNYFNGILKPLNSILWWYLHRA